MQKLIIDCDTGVDDAQAIILALNTEGFEVVAITCVAGNVSAEQAARNTVRVLHAAREDCSNIPVFVGCEKPLLNFPLLETVHTDATLYHGHDGLGDAPEATTGEPPYDTVIKSEKAAIALCKLINQHPGELTIVALGPLTNIAMAYRLDSSVLGKIKELFIMGGAVFCKGNVTVTGEFNTATDPEAAAIVIEESVCPTYLMPWESSSKGGLCWEWHSKWVNSNSKLMKFVKAVTAHTINEDRKVWDTLFCPPDLVAMAWVLNKDLVTKHEVRHCYIDCGSNPLTRGQLIVDWRCLLKRRENVTVCLDWSASVFKTLLEKLT